jgi:RND family efflux transporter MFP subunit
METMTHVISTTSAQTRYSALTLAAVLAFAACSGKRETSVADTRAPIEVAVQVASVQNGAQPFEVGGVIRARTTATLVSRIFADVQETLVQPGDRVRAGQVLVRLDGRELQAQRARAEAGVAAAEQGIKAAMSNRDAADAGLALATATHKRVAELRAKNSATPSELDQAVGGLKAAESHALAAAAAIREAEAGADAARAALRGASVGASYAVITAPFDGIVTEKRIEVGNMATPGAPLITVESPDSYRLEVRLDEARMSAVDRAQPVNVLLDPRQGDVEGLSLSGTVTEIDQALEAGAHAFVVKITLPAHPAVRSGMFGRARFYGPPRQNVHVASTAIVRHGQLTAVFVASDNHARMRLVQTGSESDGQIEIVAGLDPGEAVVVRPPAALVDGAPVRAAKLAARITPQEGR